MKRRVSLLLAVSLLLCSLISFTAAADARTEEEIRGTVLSETVEYFADGSSVTIIVAEETSITPYGSVYTKTGSKYYIMRNSNGQELWRFTVHGTFSVNEGVSATCTKASYTISITEKGWENESASAYASGNQAIGDATFIKKVLFIKTDTRSCHVVLSCDKNGVLS